MAKKPENLLTTWFSRAQETARLMVGIPDYDAYVAHMRTTHPDQQALSYEAFFANRMDARFGASNRRACC